MTNTEKKNAIALVENMVAHGYHLIQYKTAEDMVNCYDMLSLDWWQDCHDRFVGQC